MAGGWRRVARSVLPRECARLDAPLERGGAHTVAREEKEKARGYEEGRPARKVSCARRNGRIWRGALGSRPRSGID